MTLPALYDDENKNATPRRPAPRTRNPELGTRNLVLGTRNPELGTRNPELGTRNLSLSARADLLMQKALDGEFLSEAEIREFGSAMIHDSEFAEAFVLMRRIAGDAALMPLRAPSPGFAGRVMLAVRQAPPPLAPARLSRWQWGMIGVLSATAIGVLGFLVSSLTGLSWGIGEWPAQIQGWLAGVSTEVMSSWPAGAFPASGTPQAEFIVWMAIPLAAAAGALNFWSARRTGMQH